MASIACGNYVDMFFESVRKAELNLHKHKHKLLKLFNSMYSAIFECV